MSPFAKRWWLRNLANCLLVAAVVIFVPGYQSPVTVVILALAVVLHGALTDAISRSVADETTRDGLRRVASNLQRSKS
jgi:hypothetical protein